MAVTLLHGAIKPVATVVFYCDSLLGELATMEMICLNWRFPCRRSIETNLSSLGSVTELIKRQYLRFV